MLYVPDEFATVVNGPLVLPSGPTSVSLTVAPGVALPTKLTCVTPTIALLGLIAPVSVTTAAKRLFAVRCGLFEDADDEGTGVSLFSIAVCVVLVLILRSAS